MTAPLTTGNPPPELADRIRRMLAEDNSSGLRRLLARQHFADIAEAMETELEEAETVACFRCLSTGKAAQVLTSLNQDLQKHCVTALPFNTSSRILRLMPADDAVDILQELDTEQSRKILEEMPFDTETRTLQYLLMEAPDSAAGIMSTDYVDAPIDGTVGDALRLIRRADEKDFIYYCYLLDTRGELVGVVSLKQLILHDASVPLSRIAIFDVKSILVSYDQELVANLFRKYYNLLAMPVVDAENVLRGIITLDDVVDVIDEETSEDIYRASGINLEAIDEKNLLTGPVINAVKARLPWLSLTMLGQFFAATIIASYHGTVQQAVIAISFMPLLTGLSGNMGTQSDTIAVRGLSQNLINDDNIVEKYLRELRVALVTAGCLATLVGLASFFLYRHGELSLLLAGWIVISLCTSASLGILLPYGYRKFFRQDPAGVGGPFITTLSDILTFTVYLYVVTLLLDRMI